ncbi:hypothetical protein VPH35_059615 [Triticum aestivum]|uniref:Uncharacterized protein n=1 Tax=Aegilops tauschii TaxID=37682 RepID=M8C1A6_AEGTA
MPHPTSPRAVVRRRQPLVDAAHPAGAPNPPYPNFPHTRGLRPPATADASGVEGSPNPVGFSTNHSFPAHSARDQIHSPGSHSEHRRPRSDPSLQPVILLVEDWSELFFRNYTLIFSNVTVIHVPNGETASLPLDVPKSTLQQYPRPCGQAICRRNTMPMDVPKGEKRIVLSEYELDGKLELEQGFVEFQKKIGFLIKLNIDQTGLYRKLFLRLLGTDGGCVGEGEGAVPGQGSNGDPHRKVFPKKELAGNFCKGRSGMGPERELFWRRIAIEGMKRRNRSYIRRELNSKAIRPEAQHLLGIKLAKRI